MRSQVISSVVLALGVSIGCQPTVSEQSEASAPGASVEEQEATPEEQAPKEPVAQAPADAAVASLREFATTQNVDTAAARWKTRLTQPPKATFTPGKTYFWNLQTSEGPVKVKFLPDVAPMHVSSTIYLTEIGFYDGLKFHRVIPGFMAQGGCPLGTGSGSPGYKYSGEFDPAVRHDRPGLLSMANAGPGTDGSQFFLTFVPTPWLDDNHTIFGEVVEGMETLKAFESFGSRSGRTSKTLTLDKATITVE